MGSSVRAAILVGLLVSAAGCVPPGTPSASSPAIVGERSATPSPSASPGRVLDDRFGFISVDPSLAAPIVRRESEPQAIFTLGGSSGGLAVAPNGRRAAYWVDNKLHVVEVAPNAQPRVVFDRSGGPAAREDFAGFAWSSDGTGLVFATTAPSPIPGADAPPEYSALKLVEASGGPPREIIKVPGRKLTPLSWDRQVRLVAAYAAFSSGIGVFYAIGEDGNARTTDLSPGLVTLESSPDAKLVLGRGFAPDLVRLWPVGSPAQATELRSPTSEPILAARWRPGTTEITVVLSDRLELWDVSGNRRRVPLPTLPQTSNVNRSLELRIDGSAAFVGVPIDGRPELYSIAVDLASGRSAVLTGVGVASLLPVRVAP